MLIVIIIQEIKAFTLFAIHPWIWRWLVIEIKKNLKTVTSCLFAYVLQLRTNKKKTLHLSTIKLDNVELISQ